MSLSMVGVLGSMVFDTSFCRLTEIELPVVQAPIGALSTPALAAAVSQAGGLGTLSITWREPDDLRALLRRTFALTDKPFAVNLVLEWDPGKRLAIALEEGVRIISLAWGDPSPWIERVHDAGALVLHSVGSAEEARRVVAAGVDVVVAQGCEAGGHIWGQVSTMALVPRVVDAVDPVPVVAAGGIADGRGIAAVLSLGAGAAWLGTRFLLAEEAATHPIYRECLIRAAETDTTYGELFDGGWPHAPLRALRNSTWRHWHDAGDPPPGARPGEGDIVGIGPDGREIPRYDSDAPTTDTTGDAEAMVLYAGQSVGLVQRIQPASAIVTELADEAARARIMGWSNTAMTHRYAHMIDPIRHEAARRVDELLGSDASGASSASGRQSDGTTDKTTNENAG